MLLLLALPLTVLRIAANHAHNAATMNDLALHANFLNRCSDFHYDSVLSHILGLETPNQNAGLKPGTTFKPYEPSKAALLITVDNPAARQVVGRKLDRNLIAGQNPNKILPHLPRNVRKHLMLVFELNPKHRVRERLNHGRHHFNGVFLATALARFLFFVYRSFCHALLKRAGLKTRANWKFTSKAR
jgi:hypothetical protein